MERDLSFVDERKLGRNDLRYVPAGALVYFDIRLLPIPSIQLIDSPMPTTTGVEFQQQFVGKVLLALKDVLRRGEFWGIDNSLEMLDKVPRKDDLVLKTCSAEILEDVPDNYFDLITARMVFHHINDSSAAMQSAFRALKKEWANDHLRGVPPTLRSIRWFTEMFRYKAVRVTLTEIDLINLFAKRGFSWICTKTITMKEASLNNWLDNSGIPDENINIIKMMHYKAPDEIKSDYDMSFANGNCLMTWKFAITYSVK